ncbi:hypothetical protein Cylst_4748 [Cylindrospermum stagnale PCC 7417]|uniref:Uncharacterized protein n=1 Tax=Cylindrospermum stagnale PCC 7417 TaxID=56107 RepID=K9X425_9NOST|nr:hypothetical protein [Cylindrospermum stagnale]AFZ26811.1 hypothetical protein Cylst_4748 [Cylindrospermum stagnale PCC 7417]
MNTRIGILVISVITPGLIVLAISLYYFGTDYKALIKAESYVKELAEATNTNERKLEFAYHRALAHRINVFADGTWGLLGGAIAALGIHGIVTIKEKDI